MNAMRSLVWIAVTLLVTVGLAGAQSLAEVAKKEKKRRETNQSESKTVITDRELTSSYGGLPATRQTPSADGTADGAEGTEGDGGDGEDVDETKTPEYWQNRVAGTKEKIAKLEGDLAKNDWGDGQRFGVDPRGANNLGSRQQTEQQLTAARAELEAIRAEARRAGVPPGWVR